MANPLHEWLSPVRRRQQKLWALHTMTWGLLGGSIVATAAGFARLLGYPVTPALAAMLIGGGVLCGLMAGIIHRLSWHLAASAVDTAYGLKDRTTTALEFSNKPDQTDIHRLQVSDASDHLSGIDPRRAAPLQMPRILPYAIATSAACLVLFLIPVASKQADASPTPPQDHIVAQADRLQEEMLDDLEELKKDLDDKELEELVENLKEMIKEMKEPGVDDREAIAKLSEMQTLIAALQVEFNQADMSAELQSVGEALAPAAALQATAEAMKGQKFDKAADELAKVDFENLSRKESRALQQNLAKLAKDLEDGQKNGSLSKSIKALSEGLASKNKSQCKNAADKLCKLCKKQGLCKKVGNCLNCQLALLSECKCNCNKSGYCNKVAKSDSPSQSWGTGQSNKPFGDKTADLKSNRNRDEITGIAGDGPSEKEISHSPEGRQDSARSYREVYEKYQKMSEAVLESEAFPLGHRQIIRRYFENIRPQNADVDEVFQNLPEDVGK